MQIFGTSGIRCKADSSLLQLGLKVGLALGREYKKVVIGNDSRTSSPALKSALISGLAGGGVSTFDAGLLPSPTLAFATRNFDAGIMVTASHNPPEYNGIKLFNPDGTAFDERQKHNLEKAVFGTENASASWKEFSCPQPYTEAVEQHIAYILSVFPKIFPVKVVLDCGGGAGAVITPGLLKLLGCEVVELNVVPNGIFPRPSEPVEENLEELKAQVIATGADIGLAHDGDADRLMVVDGRGRFISGDKLLVILSNSLKALKLVTTLDASMLVDEQSFNVKRTPVGDNFVSQVLKTWGDFGGESSGSWIFPSVSYCPDAIFAAAQMVSIASGRHLSSMIDNLPDYPMKRGSIKLERPINNQVIEKLKELKPHSVDESDGLKLMFEDGWLLVRSSGTEPKIRITAEAKTRADVEFLYNRAQELIINALKEGSGI